MMRWLTAILLAGTTIAAAQQTGRNSPFPTNRTPTISVSSRLVVETVVATGRNGNPVPGLTAQDFVVTEDGKPQAIRFLEYQSLPPTAAVTPVPRPNPADIKIYYHLSPTGIAPETPGKTRYRNRRLLALYFDMTALPPSDQLRALDAARKFVRFQMRPDDLVAIFRYAGGGVDVLEDFTSDRERLLSILETMIVGEGQEFAEAADDASSSDTGAAFGQDSGEFNIFNTDRQLAALQTAARMLGGLSEKKELIYFASGLRLNGLDNQAQLHATINNALRAGVSIWPIDARGLVAGAPLGDATEGSQGNTGMYSGAAALAAMSDFQQSQDTLYALASDTGGKALFDDNDLTRGIRQAEQSVASYYILGYYTTNTAQDGKFRRIRITLPSLPSARLSYRQGYFAGKVFAKFNAADKERQLEDALMLKDPITDLTIAMEIDYFQLNRAEYFVPVVVKIPGQELALARKRGAEHTRIDFIGEIKDVYGGMTVTNLRDKVDIKLSDTTAEELASRPVEYDTGFTLLPGKYAIKFLARDDDTGRIGTFETTFVIPNLNEVTRKIPLSSVVLSNQRVELKNAIYNAIRSSDQQAQEAVNPLVRNGVKLIPSVTRVFRRDQQLHVYLQAYEQGVPTARPLLAYVSFYRGPRKTYETTPVRVTGSWNNRLHTVPLSFSIPLTRLASGTYDCQVTVLDPSGGKASFWQAPIMVLP